MESTEHKGADFSSLLVWTYIVYSLDVFEVLRNIKLQLCC